MPHPALYREWPARPELAAHVVCAWAARFGDDGAPHVDRVLPDGCMDIVWTGTRLLVAGPDTTAFALAPDPRATLAGIRFRPGSGPAFVGVPAAALLDTRVDARELTGSRLDPLLARLLDQLAGAPSMRAAARTLEAALLGALPAAGAPDPLVRGAVALLRATPRARPVGALARELGVGERQLHRRFVARVGYGPKMLHRVIRLRRFIAAAARAPALGLAALSADAGYADQAHLARDCARLTGLSPSRLAGTLVTAG